MATDEVSASISASTRHYLPRPNWWKLVLAGLLAFAFGIAAVLLPAQIMFSRILDVVFGAAKPVSGSLTAVAALLALVAVVAIDGFSNLLGTGLMEKQSASQARGVAGIAVAVVAVFWPGKTAFVAVELIGLWAVLIGILELVFGARYRQADDRVVTCAEFRNEPGKSEGAKLVGLIKRRCEACSFHRGFGSYLPIAV